MSDDHAPLGEIAFRCEPRDLLHSAQSAWEISTQAPMDLAGEIMRGADWYESMARTLSEIRSLPCCG